MRPPPTSAPGPDKIVDADAGLGDASGLDALGLEAFTDDAGDVKKRGRV